MKHMGEVRFMISEAAKQVHVEAHVLRYWEEELGLKIGRTEMGHRYYTEDDIQLFCCIKKLKNEGMLLRDLKPLIPALTEARQRADAKKNSFCRQRKTGRGIGREICKKNGCSGLRCETGHKRIRRKVSRK
jgi:DNA-binding transcriptional MerR regulator